jgi:hypothetical protein
MEPRSKRATNSWMMNYHTGFSDTAMDGEEVAYSPTGAGLEDSEVERKRRFKWA